MARDAGRRVMIAGGGVGGLSAALAARAAGWDAHVYERADDPNREAGTAFNLWANAVAALDLIGVAEQVRQAGDPIESMRLVDHSGRFIASTPIADIDRKVGSSSVNIRRADLTRLLHDACRAAGVPVHLGATADRYRVVGDEVVLTLADGTETRGAALIGADGARSAIRGHVTGDGAPVASSLPVRGISAVDTGVPANTVLMAWGPRGGGAGCWPLGDGHVSWTVGTNSGLRRRLERGAPAKTAVLEFLADFPPPFRDLVAATPEERIAATAVLARPRPARNTPDVWGHGPVTLLGDAAHAMPTVFAQGACQAVEDAAVLGAELAATDDAQAALRAYERRRQPRIAWLARRVYSVDRMQKFEARPLCALRDAMMRRGPAERSERSWTQMLTFDRVPERVA
jgi:2-polyprenyl-6-methoxyphenol hydroxylase-like FAD-dependent oxidoreductase